MILALALSPSLDMAYEVDELRIGDITRPTRVTRVAGGKALNVARVAATLGADVHAVAALGGHTGAWVAELLHADEVAVSVVSLAAPTRICTAIAEREGGATSTDLYETATGLSSAEWDEFAALAADHVEAGTWVALSGSIPQEPGPDAVAALLVELRSRGARIAVDGSGAGLRATIGCADFVKINRSEAAELLDAPALSAVECASAIHARYGCDVVVTDGTRGASAIIGGAILQVPSATVTGRFPAGSGDAFLGGLLASLDRGCSAAEALDLARAAAERNAAVPGQGVLGA